MNGESIFVYVNDTEEENVKNAYFIRNKKTLRLIFDVSFNEAEGTDEKAEKNIKTIKDFIGTGNTIVFCDGYSQVGFFDDYFGNNGYSFQLLDDSYYICLVDMVSDLDYKLHRHKTHYSKDQEHHLFMAMYYFYRAFYGKTVLRYDDDLIADFINNFYPVILAESQYLNNIKVC